MPVSPIPQTPLPRGMQPEAAGPWDRTLTWVLDTAIELPLCGGEMGEGAERPRAHAYWAAIVGAALLLPLTAPLLHHVPGAAEGVRGGHAIGHRPPASTLRGAARSGSPARLCTASCTPSSPSYWLISTYLDVPLPSTCVPGMALGAEGDCSRGCTTPSTTTFQ